MGIKMDRIKQARKPRWPKNPGKCRADREPAHPADPKKFTGYCAQHEKEYQIYRSQYNNATYNYRHGRSSKRPLPKDQFFEEIIFSPLATPVISISIETAAQMKTKLRYLHSTAREIERHIDRFHATLGKHPRLWVEFRKLLDCSMNISTEVGSQLTIPSSRHRI
jgi:hypothetical protein